MRSRLLLFLLLLLVSSFLCSPNESAKPQAVAEPSKDGLPGIVFVGAPVFDEKTDGGQGVYQGSYHWRDGYVYARSATYHWPERTMGPVRPGRNLFALVPATPEGKLTQLTLLQTGAVFKPAPSLDGKKVLFSLRRDGEDWFNLYEINVDGTGLRQLTDGPFNDFAGVYLPDGRIVFCSDRTGWLEEYHEERAECLFVMNGDGTGIHQITFAPGTYFEPWVMQDGRILFSFWDAFHIDVPPLDKHETYLMTVNPHGTEERHLFGAGQHMFFNRYRHGGIGFTQARELPDGRILCQSEMGPSLIDLRAGLQVRDALTPIFPGTTSVQLGGTTHLVHLSPLGTRSTAYPLGDGRIMYSATMPAARDSAIYVGDPDTREEKLVFNIPDYAEFDAVPVLVERERPRRLPVQIKDPTQYASGDPLAAPARFVVVAGRESDTPKRSEALKRARYFRVIEAEYTGVTTSSHTNLETRILGVVPIFPDGSCYFEAPADTPIFLDALDAAGNRVLQDWSHPNTSVPVGSQYPVTQLGYMVGRAGETKSCYGCHAPQTTAVPNVTLEALKHPPMRITRESTDVQYRRNEPENYRRQARIGDAAKYRPWLKSQDAVLRARACEMLMHIQDGAEPDAPTIAALLRDESVAVRRAAALALTRVGNTASFFAPKGPTGALELLERAAEKDADWLVRFHAKSALEAFHGRAKYEFIELGRQLLAEGDRKVDRDTGERAPRPAAAPVLEPTLASLESIRRAGQLKNASRIPELAAWLKKHDWEYHAAEAAVALGRIGTPEAVEALWSALRSEVPNKQVVYARYLQHGPRPEEYALLKGLVIARANPKLEDVHFLVAMLPNTFTEKPRFEDRMRDETQRVLMPRVLLENAGYRRPIVRILLATFPSGEEVNRKSRLQEEEEDDNLSGQARFLKDSKKKEVDSPALRIQLLKGINLERPFSEHGRPFPVVKAIGPEEALWLLTCLAKPGEVPEELVMPYITSKNHRERIDAAVLLGQQGFGPKAADALAAEVAKPYAFPELASIGKGMPDENFRDKAYMVQALAMHAKDVDRLKPFADPKVMYRDIRYGLTRGFARRGMADGIPLLMDMATRDPLTLIRQQARYAIADIQDGSRLRGESTPVVQWTKPQPLEALYPPRGLAWADTTPDPLPKVELTKDADLKSLFAPANFRNLNMAQARGADRLMVQRMAQTAWTFHALRENGSEQAIQSLMNALDSPYPYAQYLALTELAALNHRPAIPRLTTALDVYGKAANTVGFWWCCEALARMQAKDALPVLAKYAVPANPPNVVGPAGMGVGYIAGKALSQIAADATHPEVAKLLASDNPWLRAGSLRGLAEGRAAGVEELLRAAAAPENPALVRQEAKVQLRRLQSK